MLQPAEWPDPQPGGGKAGTFAGELLDPAPGFDAGDIRQGRSLVVTGASGTVGGFVVQLAAEAGGQIVAVAWPA